MTSTPTRIVVLTSGNVEFSVPSDDLSMALPSEVSGKKLPGCTITSFPEGDAIRFTITLHHGDDICTNPCRPQTRFAGSSVNIGKMARARD